MYEEKAVGVLVMGERAGGKHGKGFPMGVGARGLLRPSTARQASAFPFAIAGNAGDEDGSLAPFHC